MNAKKPEFGKAISLHCPYCGVTPLRREKSWFEFQAGCSSCRYLYERESGYFTGASWMINFSFVALLGFAIGFFLLAMEPKPDGLVIALIINAIIIVACCLIFPFGKALWLWLDHLLHPLTDEDTQNFERCESKLQKEALGEVKRVP